jgi:hypothetical protein
MGCNTDFSLIMWVMIYNLANNTQSQEEWKRALAYQITVCFALPTSSVT